MEATSNSHSIAREGMAAPKTRLFGWTIIGILAAFLINNVLIVGFQMPSLAVLARGEFSGLAFVVPFVYLAFIVLAAFYVMRTPGQSLRFDANRIHRFNIFFIRACFWSVLLVGLVDATIAALRVENLLDGLFGDVIAGDLRRAQFVGPYIHLPLVALSILIAVFTRTVGFSWLALLIVIAELSIVISRFVFSYEQAYMGDLVRYWYAGLFLFASAYTLYDEGHVRVDILYSGFGRTRKGFVNAIGTVALGMSTCWVILIIAFSGKQSIINGPVMNFEVTQSGTTGLYVKYQMAAFLGIFAISMLIQFVSYFFEAVADRRDEPGHREVQSTGH